MKELGKVSLVGAGPGDPELLTVRAVRCLAAAEVVVHDRLVSDAVLALVPGSAMLIPVGKVPHCHSITQEEISALLVDLALQGHRVVRLKGGDPFIFGRGSEEAATLRAAGIECEVVPGITAAQGAAAATGVPLTHRGLATGVRYMTGHCQRDLPLDADWRGLADTDTTLVLYMSAATIGLISARLIEAGAEASLPVLAVSSATTPQERRLVSTLGTIAADMEKAALAGPVLFIVGQVVTLYREHASMILAHFDAFERAGAAGHA